MQIIFDPNIVLQFLFVIPIAGLGIYVAAQLGLRARHAYKNQRNKVSRRSENDNIEG